MIVEIKIVYSKDEEDLFDRVHQRFADLNKDVQCQSSMYGSKNGEYFVEMNFDSRLPRQKESGKLCE